MTMYARSPPPKRPSRRKSRSPRASPSAPVLTRTMMNGRATPRTAASIWTTMKPGCARRQSAPGSSCGRVSVSGLDVIVHLRQRRDLVPDGIRPLGGELGDLHPARRGEELHRREAVPALDRATLGVDVLDTGHRDDLAGPDDDPVEHVGLVLTDLETPLAILDFRLDEGPCNLERTEHGRHEDRPHAVELQPAIQ